MFVLTLFAQQGLISVSDTVRVIIYILCAGLIFGLLLWLVDMVNPREPLKQVARALLAIVAVVFLIALLLSFMTGVPIFRP